jgi:AbiV family abortive infection protein
MTGNVSEQTLLEGAWFALEQAGRLLHSAKVLFEIGDFSTAVAVAMFSREELGRSRLLRVCSRDVRKGQVLQTKDITKRCQDHVVKQNASVGSITLRTTNDTELGKALQTQREYAPSSAQWKRAESFINSAHEAKQKRQPNERHQLRCSSLYVDINGMGTDWARPVEIFKEEARNHICDAVNDYSHEVDRLTNEDLRSMLEQHSPRVCAEAMNVARKKWCKTLIF